MVQLFLLNANASAGENLSYWLTNAGGQFSCRCYTNAFKECGYKVFGYIKEQPYGRDDTKRVKKEMTADLCKTIYRNPKILGENNIYMGFVYSGVSGGKRKNSKTKKSKTKKSKTKKNKTKKSKTKKSKTKKSKKNKTAKNNYI